MFDVRKQQRTAAVLQQGRDLIGVQSGVKRNRGATGCDYAQICRHPARMVVGQNCHPRACLQVAFCQPRTHRLRHAPYFRVGVAFDLFAALNFEGDVLWPVFDTLDKAIVEGGHWFAEILHENADDCRQPDFVAPASAGFPRASPRGDTTVARGLKRFSTLELLPALEFQDGHYPLSDLPALLASNMLGF